MRHFTFGYSHLVMRFLLYTEIHISELLYLLHVQVIVMSRIYDSCLILCQIECRTQYSLLCKITWPSENYNARRAFYRNKISLQQT